MMNDEINYERVPTPRKIAKAWLIFLCLGSAWLLFVAIVSEGCVPGSNLRCSVPGFGNKMIVMTLAQPALFALVHSFTLTLKRFVAFTPNEIRFWGNKPDE